MNGYTISSTQPTVYLDRAGKVVNGFQVTVTLNDYNETHLVNVPDLDKTKVKTAIEKLVTDRKALDTLGNDEE